MNRIDEIKKKLAHLVCLVPSKEAISKKSMLLTCHEKTLCDCSVLEITNELLTVIDDMKAALEFYGDDKNWSDNKFIVKSDVELRDNEFNDPCGKRARQTLTKYFGSGK